MSKLLVFLMILLSSCAPMPGNTLMEGLEGPTELKDIKEHRVVIDPVVTSVECNKLLLQRDQYGTFMLNLIGNGGFILGCTDIAYDKHIERCIVYLSFPIDHFLEHELRHCMGYKDLLY